MSLVSGSSASAGPFRRAEIPGESEPIYLGVHDEVAEHYGVATPGDAERATTLDPDIDRGKIERAFEHHMPRCPVYRSIGAAIDCTTELEIVDG
jgi:uncharacterized OsmC-like protein